MTISIRGATLNIPRSTGRVRNRALPANSPLDVGDKWMFLGDSQTSGRATGTTTGHAHAFCRIWETKFPSTGPDTPYTSGFGTDPHVNGVSGRRLAVTAEYYDGRAERLTNTWLHVQESGSQGDGQDTAENFKATYLAFWRQAALNTPNAIFTYESAFSFGREDEPGRNWDDWNVAMREANTELALEGTTVHVVETDAAIKALQTELTPGDVWFQEGEANEYHYEGLGNLMDAVMIFKTLGHTLTMADLADIAEISDAWKQITLDVAEAL